MASTAGGNGTASGIRRGLVLLFALAGGVGVGNLYWAQPILGDIAAELNVAPATAGLLVTVSQLGYAVGVFLLVPLGDTVNRKRMIPLMLVLCALSLAGCALAPNFALLLIAFALVGLTNVAGQLLMGLAGDVATDGQRARVVATIASGLMLGILLSRTVSGIVADLFGWRMVYAGAGAMILLLAIIMARAIPTLAAGRRIPYGRLLGSVVEAVVRHPPVRIVTVLGAALMCVFIAFWTGLTFLLTTAPYSFTASQVGLVSLLGVMGVIGTQFVGRLYDRGWGVASIGVGLLITLASLAVAGFGRNSIVAVLIAVSLFSVGVQPVLVLLQTMMVSMAPAARSRLNTAHIVSNFIGGAAGAALAAALWQLSGWVAVIGGSAVIVVFALTVWLVGRNRALAHSAEASSVALGTEVEPSSKGRARPARASSRRPWARGRAGAAEPAKD